MKYLKICMIMLLSLIIPTLAFASDNDVPEIKSEEELISCITEGGYCKLGTDLKLLSTLKVSSEVILELNGQSINPSDGLENNGGLILVERGAKLTIKDSKGTGKISTRSKDNSDVWAAIQLIYANQDSSELAELVVDGGTIEGFYYGITGNGKNHNSKVTINGGTITALNDDDSVGIYQPQIGTLTVNGGTIKGGTGIEIRSGDLTINDGTIEGIAPEFLAVKNTNGSTTNGVGVTVAQHSTKNEINVEINGGNISGQYAFYEWNPMGNSALDLEKISISITGGNFTGTATGVGTVYSEDFRKFISGGKFNKSVSDYATDDAELVSAMFDDITYYDNKSSKAGIIILVIGTIIAICAGAYYYLKKSNKTIFAFTN